METKFIGIVNKNGRFLSELKLKGKALSYKAGWSSFLSDALFTPSTVLVNNPEQLDNYKHMAKMVKSRLVEVEVTYTVRDIETGEEVEMTDGDKKLLEFEKENADMGEMLGGFGALFDLLGED